MRLVLHITSKGHNISKQYGIRCSLTKDSFTEAIESFKRHAINTLFPDDDDDNTKIEWIEK